MRNSWSSVRIGSWIAFLAFCSVTAWSYMWLPEPWDRRRRGVFKSNVLWRTVLYSQQLDTTLLASRIANLTESMSTMTDWRNSSSSSFQLRQRNHRTRTPATANNHHYYPATNSRSLENAIEQVHALFDFSHRIDGEFWRDDHDELSALGTGAMVSTRNPMAIQALESLFSRILRNMQTIPSHPVQVVRSQKIRVSKLVLTEDQLEKLHHLFRRVNDIPIVPTLKTMESLWLIYKQHWQTTTDSGSSNETCHNERYQILYRYTTHLLLQWLQWSSQQHPVNPLSGHPLPTLYFQQWLKSLWLAGMPMTEDIWTVYNAYCVSLWQQPKQHPTDNILREVFMLMLEILSYSEKPWRGMQCQVLQRMVMLRENYKYMHLKPTEMELLCAIREAASAGRVNETAWICRQTNSSQVRSYFLPSLLYCKQPGSLLYMEKYVMSEALDRNFHTNTESIKMLLQKCSVDSDIRSAGRRAERIFHQLRNHSALRQWQPDYECIQFVVDAYLQMNSSTPQVSWKHVLAADRFVRFLVQNFGVHAISKNDTIASCKVFENILQAYSLRCDSGEATLILKHSDAFFRFFLVHHRRGRITAEVPSGVHFALMIHSWKQFLDSHAAAEKIAEYTFLSSRLQNIGK